MLERQQLRIEDALLGVARGTAKLASNASRHVIDQLPWNFRQVRRGNELAIPPDPTTLGDVDIHRSLEDVRNMMFNDPRQRAVSSDHLLTVAGSGPGAELVQYNFFDRRYRYDHHGLFWGAYALDDFLARYVFARLQRSGRAYVELRWGSSEERVLIDRLNLLDENEIRQVRLGQRSGSFRYVERWHHAFPKRHPEVRYMDRRDVAVFQLQPPFAVRPGKTRLPEARRVARQAHRLMDAQLAYFHATTDRSDRRWWAERARLLNGETLMEEWRRSEARIRGILGGMPVLTSMDRVTKYFHALGIISFYERVARARESLLGEFNHQIVEQLLGRNSFERTSVRIVVSSVRTSDDWRRLRESFEAGELTYDDVGKELVPAPSEEEAEAEPPKPSAPAP